MAASCGLPNDQNYSQALGNFNRANHTEILKLKPLQVKALDVLLSGKDCLCSLPTGYGKSLIFELLPFIDPNCLVVIIEPLNVIMAQEAHKLGIKSMCLTSRSDLTGIKNGTIKYIFCHPEDILDNKKVMEMFRSDALKTKQIFLVVDEAHCILEWGDDFRPDFKRLGNLRSVFRCQVLALTATVTCVGQKQVMKNLLMKNCASVCSPPTKTNIVLAVLKRPSATSKGNTATSPYDFIFQKVLNELKDQGKNFPITVIYCKSIQWIGYGYELAREILGDQFYEGEHQRPEHARVVMFHSSMEDSNGKLKAMILADLQKPPSESSIRLVFASVALGMGADLRHVKRVIHAGPPSTLETYVQEIGRAGRADSQAQAILYFNGNDLATKHMQSNMKDFCKNNEKCKRELVNEHFGFDEFDKPTMCCNICQPDMSLQWDFSKLSISDPL